MKVNGTPYRTVWRDGTTVFLIDQPLLPHRFEIAKFPRHEDTARAITTMVTRGAGAIGAAAGHGMAQVALEAPDSGFEAYVRAGAKRLENTRPTAQDLFYAVQRVMAACLKALPDVAAARQAACREADTYAEENYAAGEQIGIVGAPLMVRRDGGPGPVRIVTHCNAGWLAFVDWGSALSPIYRAHRDGKEVFVWVDETRPRGQGARLTAWELAQEGVPHALIADTATGYYMAKGEVDLVIVGADRIARNGDVANKIGTYTRAEVANALGIPFYVAAPTSTIDPDCADGSLIPIEERDEEEVTWVRGVNDAGELTRVRITGEGTRARNPAFDVTPNRLIKGIITEVGVFEASPEGIGEALKKRRF